MAGYTEALADNRRVNANGARVGRASFTNPGPRSLMGGFAKPVAKPKPSESDAPLIVVVDDDDDVRESLGELMQSVGLETACFGSTQELQAAVLPDRPGCLVLDVRMPGSSGLDFQHRLASKGNAKPIVFITGHGDIPMTVQAMKAGAIDFLIKPVRDQALLDAVKVGIEKDIERRAMMRIVKEHADRFATLTPRERQVMREVARGQMNKQIAFDLGISQITVKLHRSNVMRKMQAASVGELIRAWEMLPVRVQAIEPL
jgi:FixJ family two-component response regulator